ncbi:GWxTD domain-containing protein [Candidatus Aminicenantes bacterium AC-335-A11]|nr:GWxTD domain-containing protein [SCandidatus Aminicenantes bacterium Aminicenantia_JdfR_composite]MCP2597128.1 GWxTD domain-containing protein [Candidatus Aminicenantes bacterium AC-335-G13]MCP2606457.1 GWxTD domain-containing protein [Candidatus Aminicenantes bacterium AC-708-I09]MCP2618607.1 GWxTD domain-containing protein [Candidatus Aminicenantes bacterium AC-335-A11]
MKKLLIVLVLLLSFNFIISPANKKSPKDLPEKYRKWLEEEVVYIITPKEREIFLQLETDKERDMFIEAFWKQRDPTPGTPRNEFKEEHYRRIAYANRVFGRGTPRPGWKTDRGRIYIILGEPLDIERFEGQSLIYPTEIWFYKGDQRYGLPAFFNIVFYKDKGIGEYKLYSPVTDTFRKLIIDKRIAGGDPETAYYELYQYDPELAQAAFSLIPGENPPLNTPSLSSEILLGNVLTLPHRKVKDEYAEKLLKYKDIVELDYTANYISCDYLISVIKDEEGNFYVNYSIEPSALSVDYYNKKYLAHFELNGKVTDLKGKIIFQYGKSFSLEIPEEKIDQLRASSYAIQDCFPLVPGSYKLSVILKNTVSKEFTSIEKDIYIPKNENIIQMSPLILGFKTEKKSYYLNVKKPFTIEDFQIFSYSKNIYTNKDNLIVFYQVYNLSPDIEKNGFFKYIIKNKKKIFLSISKPLTEFGNKQSFLVSFPLTDFSPGFYTIRVSLYDKDNNEILFEEKEFQVSAFSVIPRPWIISKIMPKNEKTRAEIKFILANQYYSLGNIEKAKRILEEINKRFPQLRYAQLLGEIYFLNKEYQKVKELLMPYKNSNPKSFAFLALLGKTCQALGEFEEAIKIYKEYLLHEGTNLNILNLIGDCYYKLGDNEQALIAWRKSLELNPNQPSIKQKIEQLKKK